MRVYEASTLTSAEFGGIRDLSRHLSLNLVAGIIHSSWLHSSTKISLGFGIPAKGEKYEAKLSPLKTTWLELVLAVHPQPEAKSDSIFLLSPNVAIGVIGLLTY